MGKIFSHKIYLVKGREKPFHHFLDAKQWCDDNGCDPKQIEVYDSTKEYDRWIMLQEQERQGIIADLKRQVEYELIPKMVEHHLSHFKDTPLWSVSVFDGTGAFKSLQVFKSRKEACAFCKSNGIKASKIVKGSFNRPIYKETIVEKNAVYTADFVYRKTDTNEVVVEDVKSEYTRKEKDYVLRRKLMLFRYGIKIKEIVL